MSVANGDINLNVNMRGTGDAPAKLEQTRAAIGKVEGAAKSTTSQFVSLRGGISEVASVASSAAGDMTRDFSAVVGLVSDASSRFGALGAVVGGVVAAVGGLVYAFVELDKARFENVTRSLQGTANAAGALAVALATSANKARELQTTMRSAEVRALTAQIASARARGDTTGAASLAGQLTILQSGDEAGALRAQGVGAFAASAEALAARAGAEALLAKTNERIKFIDGQLAQKAIVLQENGRYVARDELEAERAGLLGMRATQIGSLALLSQNAAAQNVAAASALYKAADAVTQQGLLEATTGVLNNAVDVIRAAGGSVTKGGGGGGGAGGGRVAGRLLDGQLATKEQRDLYRALLGAGTDTGLMGIVGQGIIDRAFVAQGDKGIRLEDGAGSMADVSIGAANDNARLIAGAIQDSGNRAQLGADIRDFTSALSAAVPEMDAFHGALAKIGDIWSEWGKGAMNAKTAVVGSLAAIGLAGAESIKNEQLRAGVRALILGAEGAVHLLTPGYQALGAAEIAAAGVLGAIALGGGGGSSSSRAPTGGGGARALRPMSDSATNAALVVNINAPWFGPSPQEAAAGMAAFARRADGTGWS